MFPCARISGGGGEKHESIIYFSRPSPLYLCLRKLDPYLRLKQALSKATSVRLDKK